MLDTARNAWLDSDRARDSSVRALDDARTRSARWWLACLAIGPIATFTLVSLGGIAVSRTGRHRAGSW